MFGTTNSITRAALLGVLLPLLAACATGPTFSDLHTSEPAVAADRGRIYFYRESSMAGAALQPAIKIDGTKVGEAVPGGYFFVDQPVGTYKISTTTEKEESVDLTVVPPQTRYVRFDVSIGLLVGHVSPSIIDPEEGSKEIKDCHYAGAGAGR